MHKEGEESICARTEPGHDFMKTHPLQNHNSNRDLPEIKQTLVNLPQRGFTCEVQLSSKEHINVDVFTRFWVLTRFQISDVV